MAVLTSEVCHYLYSYSLAQKLGSRADEKVTRRMRPADNVQQLQSCKAPYTRSFNMADCSTLSFYRPKDGKEDLGPHVYTIRNSSHSFHARVHGDLSVSIRLAFPYKCGSA